MKQLISATLSEEAAKVYNSWEKQKKSARLSEMIVKEDGNLNHISALQTKVGSLQQILGAALVHIHLKDPSHPLCESINEALFGTIYYQYWEKPSTIVEEVKEESAAEKMNREFFEKTGEYLF